MTVLPELALLLELQRRDAALAESKRRQGEFPKRRQALALALDRARASLLGIQKEREAVRLARRVLEKEVESFQAELTRLEKQLFDVKTNDEFTAMQHQIANVKSKRSDGETEILELMDREESLTAGVAKGEGVVAEAERALKDGNATLDAEAAALDAEVSERTHVRDEGRAPIGAPTLAKYDRLYAGREGLAIVRVDNNACGACHRALTAHDMQLAKQGESILSCEGCGRIVVYGG
ncbi:MAG: C4-type zinc ribbon domain-containing protein [Candidatus Eisenbacteria bacterium]